METVETVKEFNTDRDYYFYFVHEYKSAIKTATGEWATFLYVLRSHLRKRLHMRWWRKYHGGKVAYLYDGKMVTGTEIDTLEDQEKWLLEQIKSSRELIKREKEFRKQYPERKWYWEPLVVTKWIDISTKLLGVNNED